MSKNRLRVGVIGLGAIAQLIHLPTLSQMCTYYEIVALCDISEQLLQYIGDRYQVDRLYTDLHDLATQKDIDLIFVLNSDEAHTESVLAAVNNHKHVFVEKPMCLTFKEAESIIEARDAAGVQVMVGYMRRFAPAFLQGVEMVKGLDRVNYARIRDIIGPNSFFIDQTARVVSFNDIPDEARVRRKERYQALVNEATGGDSPQLNSLYMMLSSLGVHDLSAMREMLGFPSQVISAVQGSGGFLTAIFAFDGFNATFEAGVDHQGRFDASLEVLGDTKTIRVQYNTPYIRHLPTKLFMCERIEDGYGEIEIRPTYSDPYTFELEYLHRVLTSGEQPKTTPEDFKDDLLLCQMIVEEFKQTQSRILKRSRA